MAPVPIKCLRSLKERAYLFPSRPPSDGTLPFDPNQQTQVRSCKTSDLVPLSVVQDSASKVVREVRNYSKYTVYGPVTRYLPVTFVEYKQGFRICLQNLTCAYSL
jgi:hypothetical protein